MTRYWGFYKSDVTLCTLLMCTQASMRVACSKARGVPWEGMCMFCASTHTASCMLTKFCSFASRAATKLASSAVSACCCASLPSADCSASVRVGICRRPHMCRSELVQAQHLAAERQGAFTHAQMRLCVRTSIFTTCKARPGLGWQDNHPPSLLTVFSCFLSDLYVANSQVTSGCVRQARSRG